MNSDHVNARSVLARVGKLLSGIRKPRAGHHASDEELWERSRVRWRKAEPVTHLTWGREVSGDDFVSKMNSYGAFGSDKSLLEIGPGYGRLLKSIAQQGVPFKKYLGVDLSERNISYLNENFGNSKITFQHGDIEELQLSEKFDLVFSSLTFKHLFPSFEKVLHNVRRCLNPGALIFFDLIEGAGRHFEQDGITYLRHYSREEVAKIFDRSGLDLIAWDEVLHTPEHSRLLVVAKKLAAPLRLNPPLTCAQIWL